eukprot:CAMPEP_0203919168 /NCGR_PEP_ID=MMETSP0359-20131031/59635_1 /ASSEMBLY_ACC=CAM_ASM_000338 /TAXON_ID=268821 /ORGANISM="Scrippsiella Hangoei, Strain SHTV-5" /LENGTH=31 /DNA_ID= /DNA_START= /DNA_END= /DNA_ORIENTATION=
MPLSELPLKCPKGAHRPVKRQDGASAGEEQT